MVFKDDIEGEKIFHLQKIRSVAKGLYDDYSSKHLGEAYCWEYTKNIINEVGGNIYKNLIELFSRHGEHCAAKFQTKNGEYAVDITFSQFFKRFMMYDELRRQKVPVFMLLNDYLDLMRRIEYTLDGPYNISESYLSYLPIINDQSKLNQDGKSSTYNFSYQIKSILNF